MHPRTIRLKWRAKSGHSSGKRIKLESLYGFSVNREVESLALDFGVNTEPYREIHQLEQDQRGNRVVEGDDRDAVELRDHLMRIAVDQPTLASPPTQATNTPVRKAPTAPPMPCTPKTSRLSS